MSIILSVSYSPDDTLIACIDTKVCVRIFRTTTSETAELSLKNDCFVSNMTKEKVSLHFVDSSRIVVFLSGRLYNILIGVSPNLSLRHIGTVCAPPGASCIDVGLEVLLVGTLSGDLYVTDLSGTIKFKASFRDEITCVKSFSSRVLVGTRSGMLILYDLTSKLEISKLKTQCINSIVLDSKCNWFCCITNKTLISGSTRSLSQFFESAPLDLIPTRIIFATVNGALSILASNPSPNILLFPIDLSSSMPRLQLSKLDAVFDMQSSKGNFFVCAGPRGIQIVSSNNLQELETTLAKRDY